jgi:carbon catabolite-derepressing protein kinase
VNLYMDEN